MAKQEKFSCPHCGMRYNVRPDWVGQKAKCKGCKTTFAIPGTPTIKLPPNAGPIDLSRDHGPLSEMVAVSTAAKTPSTKIDIDSLPEAKIVFDVTPPTPEAQVIVDAEPVFLTPIDEPAPPPASTKPPSEPIPPPASFDPLQALHRETDTPETPLPAQNTFPTNPSSSGQNGLLIILGCIGLAIILIVVVLLLFLPKNNGPSQREQAADMKNVKEKFIEKLEREDKIKLEQGDRTGIKNIEIPDVPPMPQNPWGNNQNPFGVKSTPDNENPFIPAGSTPDNENPFAPAGSTPDNENPFAPAGSTPENENPFMPAGSTPDNENPNPFGSPATGNESKPKEREESADPKTSAASIGSITIEQVLDRLKHATTSNVKRLLKALSRYKPDDKKRETVCRTMITLLENKQLAFANTETVDLLAKWMTPKVSDDLAKLISKSTSYSGLETVKQLARIPDDKVAAAVVEAWSKQSLFLNEAITTLGTRAEEPLWQVLKSEDKDLQIAACEFLAAQGTLKSILKLSELAYGKGVDRDVAKAAEDAIKTLTKKGEK